MEADAEGEPAVALSLLLLLEPQPVAARAMPRATAAILTGVRCMMFFLRVCGQGQGALEGAALLVG
jgi:hypothetical protein